MFGSPVSGVQAEVAFYLSGLITIQLHLRGCRRARLVSANLSEYFGLPPARALLQLAIVEQRIPHFYFYIV